MEVEFRAESAGDEFCLGHGCVGESELDVGELNVGRWMVRLVSRGK